MEKQMYEMLMIQERMRYNMGMNKKNQKPGGEDSGYEGEDIEVGIEIGQEEGEEGEPFEE
jgi:hypothetical protein